MATKIDVSKKYWFYLSSDVYVSHNEDDKKVLLYNTKTGEYLETGNPLLIRIVKEVYIPKNLGVIRIDSIIINKLSSILEIIIAKGLGGIKDIKENEVKPINLLPILNLSKDIEKIKKHNDTSSIMSGTLQYLSELNIYVNEECKQNCILCDTYYKQVKCCCKFENNEELPLEQLIGIFKQIKHSMVKKVNILGGNLFEYSHFNKMINFFPKFNEFKFHLWINYLSLTYENISLLKQKNIYKVIIFTFPLYEDRVEWILDKYKDSKFTQFNFIIENEKEYATVVKLTEKFHLNNAIINPLYTKRNIDFFEDNIYLNKGDIMSGKLSMREIFRNQKLNLNNFGSLTIFANGTVKANINSIELGNIYKNSMLEVIQNELIKNTAWRKVRNNGKCKDCLYKFLCPPPSNYEYVIGRPNLCHVKC